MGTEGGREPGSAEESISSARIPPSSVYSFPTRGMGGKGVPGRKQTLEGETCTPCMGGGEGGRSSSWN